MNDSLRTSSRYLSRLDLNKSSISHGFESYWCRVSFKRFERINTRLQRHSFFELHYCISGNCRFILKGTEMQLKAGEYVLVHPGAEHMIPEASNDFEKLVWGFSIFDEPTSKSLNDGCAKSRFPMPSPPGWLTSVDRLLFEGGLGGDCSVEIIDNELYYILQGLKRELVRSAVTERPAVKPGIRAEAVYRFIGDNLAENPSVSDIAAQFYLSERQLQRVCIDGYGMNVSELRKSIRSREIRRLLAETTLTLGEIANLTGFSDRYSMSKFFKSSEGLSPAKYRASILE